MSNALNFGLLGTTPAQQQAQTVEALRARMLDANQGAGSPSQKGLAGAAGIAQFMLRRRAQQQQEEEANLILRHFNGGQAGAVTSSGDSIRQMALAMNRAGVELAAQGGRDARSRGLQLRQRALEMLQQQEQAEAAQNLLLAQTDQATTAAAFNTARAEVQMAPESPIGRMQRERDTVLAQMRQFAPGPTRDFWAQKADELTKGIEQEGLENVDPSLLTTSVESATQNSLIAARQRLVRLQEAAEGFDPELLTIPGKGRVFFAAVREKLGGSTEATTAALDQWTGLAHTAKEDSLLVLKALSGVAVSDQERLRRMAVDLNPGTYTQPWSGDPPSEYQSKLANLLKWQRAAIAQGEFLLQQGAIADWGTPISEALASQFPLEMFLEPTPDAQPQQPVTTTERTGAAAFLNDEELAGN